MDIGDHLAMWGIINLGPSSWDFCFFFRLKEPLSVHQLVGGERGYGTSMCRNYLKIIIYDHLCRDFVGGATFFFVPNSRYRTCFLQLHLPAVRS